MKYLILASLVMFAGCIKTRVEHAQERAATIVAIELHIGGHEQTIPDVPDTSDECDNCGGDGKDGDGANGRTCKVCGGTGKKKSQPAPEDSTKVVPVAPQAAPKAVEDKFVVIMHKGNFPCIWCDRWLTRDCPEISSLENVSVQVWDDAPRGKMVPYFTVEKNGIQVGGEISNSIKRPTTNDKIRALIK